MQGILCAKGVARSIGLGLLLIGLAGCGKKHVEASHKPELSTEFMGMVKGGKGSGVVGGPIEGVQVTAQAGEKVVGPVTTDASGSFDLDVLGLFPAGTQNTPEGLQAAKPIAADVKFEKPGFKTQVETVTFPLPKYEESTFYLSGEGE